MATVQHHVREHDVVTLREPVGAWPAGRSGTVVSDYGNVKLVEISDPENGEMLDLIPVAADRLALKRPRG